MIMYRRGHAGGDHHSHNGQRRVGSAVDGILGELSRHRLAKIGMQPRRVAEQGGEARLKSPEGVTAVVACRHDLFDFDDKRFENFRQWARYSGHKCSFKPRQAGGAFVGTRTVSAPAAQNPSRGMISSVRDIRYLDTEKI